jgi:hypothetical protein
MGPGSALSLTHCLLSRVVVFGGAFAVGTARRTNDTAPASQPAGCAGQGIRCRKPAVNSGRILARSESNKSDSSLTSRVQFRWCDFTSDQMAPKDG